MNHSYFSLVLMTIYFLSLHNSEKKLITDALNKNQFLKRLDPQQIKDMVECMYGRNYPQGSYIIKQGEPGNHIFVLAGEFRTFFFFFEFSYDEFLLIWAFIEI